jgi:hypothetical protein
MLIMPIIQIVHLYGYIFKLFVIKFWLHVQLMGHIQGLFMDEYIL